MHGLTQHTLPYIHSTPKPTMATTTVTPASITAAFPALAPALAALPKPQGKTLSYGTAGACVRM